MPITIDSVPVSGPTVAFTTVQTDAGTSPVADSTTDTLTLTSSDSSVTITGDSSTDTVDFDVSESYTCEQRVYTIMIS